MREFGFTNPVLISERNDIIAGHGRVRAAALAKIDSIPCVRLSHLSETQRKAYVIADNRLALNAGWDSAMLSLELAELKLEDFDLDLLGFEQDELDALLNPEQAPTEGLTDPDEVPENVETRCKPGDLWVLGTHRLLCGDSTNVQHVERLMGGEKADMVFTDPPYGVDYDGGTTKRTKLANDHDESIYAKVLPLLVMSAKDDAAFFIWFAMSFSAAVSAAVSAAGLVERKTIIWNKNLAQFGALSAQYKDKYEPCTYAFKKGSKPKWFGPTNEVSVWDISRASKNEFHPTQKPVELAERALGNHTTQGMMLLDLFLGSGSALIACEKTGRRCFGMELDPHYCSVILARWEAFTGKVAVLEASDG
jgi:DNA modification methylase